MKDYADMVKEIAEVASDALNEWECEFIENVLHRRSFSEKQEAVIERIYEKVCRSSY